MKRFITITMIITSISLAYADGKGKSKAKNAHKELTAEQVTELKARAVKNLDGRIGILTDTKKCIQGAKTGKDLRSCHEKQRDKMKTLTKGNRKHFMKRKAMMKAKKPEAKKK